MSHSRRAPILGIDLGTHKSMACVVLEGDDRPTIIQPHPRLPADWMPSVFCMKKTSRWWVKTPGNCSSTTSTGRAWSRA